MDVDGNGMTFEYTIYFLEVAGGGADGSRVWAVAGSGAPTAGSGTPLPTVRPTLPQSLAVLNGRRFIVVPRSLVHSDHH